MPYRLVHSQNKPSIDIKEGGDFERAIFAVRESLSDLLRTGALNVLANYAVESVNNSESSRVALNNLVGALLNETPIKKTLRGIDPFDKQNILLLALSDFEFQDDYIMKTTDNQSRRLSDSATTRVTRRTPRPPNPLGR